MKPIILGVLLLGLIASAHAAQEFNGRTIYFGDTHFHTGLSHDSCALIEQQYESLLYRHACDFAMHSEHAETEAKFPNTDPCTSIVGGGWGSFYANSPEEIVEVMRRYCDEWTGRQYVHPQSGPITFVVFPGYEWAPEPEQYVNCGPSRNAWCGDSNADDWVPGHINFFFDRTTGWNYSDDVWDPYGERNSYAEILGQFIHQRDDPNRPYDLLIQMNHPAHTEDNVDGADIVTRWADFAKNDCLEWRLRYGVSGVEWYAEHEAALGTTTQHDTEFHHNYHQPNRYVVSRALKEGFKLAMWGGSDNHDGDAGGGTLTAVYATGATRSEIWAGLKSKRTYTLSKFQGGAVHKGRVDLTCSDADNGLELRMGQTAPAPTAGAMRIFTITAAAEVSSFSIFPRDLYLYRVNRDTVLSSATRESSYRLRDDKYGDLLVHVPNEKRTPSLTASRAVAIRPGDAIFAVVEYSDGSNYTIARTTPIWFEAMNETASVASSQANVTFRASPAISSLATGGVDAGQTGDGNVLAVGATNPEWSQYQFYLPEEYKYCHLSFLTQPDSGGSADYLFAVRIDGDLVYSGRGGVDHPVNRLHEVTRYFPLRKGLHVVEIHMDDQEYIEDDDDFACGDYDGPYGFVDALRFSLTGTSSVAFYVDGSSTCKRPAGRRDCVHDYGPFKTVVDGRDGTPPGDTLRIRRGHYTERLSFSAPLTIEAYDGQAIIGRGP